MVLERNKFTTLDIPKVARWFWVVWVGQLLLALAFLALIVWGACELGSAVIDYLRANS